jgi:hypothetical protein
MEMPLIYTYHYGVLCVACNAFIWLGEYQTADESGIVDVSLGVALRCRHCGDTCIYCDDRVVYSRSREVMVPLTEG